MKKITFKNSVLLLGIIFLLASCANQVSVTKRYHGNGWYFGFGGKGTKTENLVAKNHRKASTPLETVVSKEIVADNIAVSAEIDNGSTTPEIPTVFASDSRKLNFVEKQLLKKAAKKISRSIAETDKVQVEKSGKNAVLKAGNKIFKNGNGLFEVDTILLVLLCFFFPPLAVYLYEGEWTSRCTINLILTLLCFLPGFIHALIVVLGKN